MGGGGGGAIHLWSEHIVRSVDHRVHSDLGATRENRTGEIFLIPTEKDFA